jgi:hypothetical protein
VAYAELVAALGIFLPAAALVWFLLGRYEGYFEDNRLFFAMGAGLFAALVLRFLEVKFFGFDQPYVIQGNYGPYTSGTLVYSFAYTAVGYGLLEAMGMTAILGFSKFRMRKDSAYYGTALGIAFGAMWATEFVSAGIWTDGQGHMVTDSFHVVDDALLVLLGMGIGLAHAAAGTYVGRECGAGKLARAGLFGTLWLAPAFALQWCWLNAPQREVAAIACLAWGIVGLVIADRKVLQVIVPPEVRDQMGKQRRRERRRFA